MTFAARQSATIVGVGGYLGSKAEPPFPWVLVNLFRLAAYLLAASLVSGIAAALTDEYAGGVVGRAQALAEYTGLYFFYGGLYCLPALVAWLVILARLPLAWSGLMRRLVAIATAPLVGVILLLMFIPSELDATALIYGFLLPLGSGFVVRLRRPWPVAVLSSAGAAAR